MRTILLLLFFSFFLPSSAQDFLTLEAKLDGNVYPFCQKTLSLCGLGKDMFFPTSIKAENNHIKAKIYNGDYSLYADIDTQIEIDSNYTLQSVNVISSLTTNGKVMFIVDMQNNEKGWGDDGHSRMCLYNEKGNMIYDFGQTDGSYSCVLGLFGINDTYKFIVYEISASSKTTTYVYRVNSNLISSINVAETCYNKAQIPTKIYDTTGKLVGIQDAPMNIKRPKLPKGVYIYNSSDSNGKFIIK